jgi:putative transposase
MARQAIHDHRVTVRLACQAFKISETCYRYDPKLSSENELIADWLLRLTTTHKQWGFGLCFMYLRNTKGFKWNHKRVYRIYKQLELNLRIKPRRRIKRDKPQALSVPLSINQTWSIDFMSDSLDTGRKIRTFNVIDDYNRECLGIEVDHSLPAQRVIKSLEQLIEWRGKPKAIRCDNGPEYISHALREWAQAMDIELMYIQPGKPTQNAYIERFNRTARNEWLNMHIFDSIEHAQSLATQWMWVYNNVRPHSSIGGIPPRKLLEAI